YFAVPAQETTLAGARLADSVLTEAAGAIASTALTPDGRFAVVGTYDGEVQMWDLAERRRVLAVEHQPGPVWGVAVSADGQRVGTGAGDGMVRVWDAPSGECI